MILTFLLEAHGRYRLPCLSAETENRILDSPKYFERTTTEPLLQLFLRPIAARHDQQPTCLHQHLHLLAIAVTYSPINLIRLFAQADRIEGTFVQHYVEPSLPLLSRWRAHYIPHLKADVLYRCRRVVLFHCSHPPSTEFHARVRIIDAYHVSFKSTLVLQQEQHLAIARSDIEERSVLHIEIQVGRSEILEDF